MSKLPHPLSEPTPDDPTPDSAREDDWVAVGEIVGVFGVQGALKVRPLTDFPDRFQRTETVYLGEKRQPRQVINATTQGRNIVLRLVGIDTPEDGTRLRGVRIYIPDAELTPLSGGQYYVHDVIGLRVLRDDGAPLGTVADVISNGANDLYVVRDDQTGTETLLPAVKQFVKAVDVAGGKLIVTPIPGLFDDNAEEAK